MTCYCGDCQKCGHRCSKCDQRYPGQFPNDYPSCDCNTRASTPTAPECEAVGAEYCWKHDREGRECHGASTPPTPQAEFATCSSAELFQALGKSAAEAETMERGLNAVIRRADMKPVAPKAEGGVGKAVKWICACLDVVDYTAIGRSKELLNVLTAATECQFNAERARALQEQVLSDYDVIDQLRLELAKSKEQGKMRNVIQQMIDAIKADGIDSHEIIGEPEVGIPSHKWHEEWLYYAEDVLSTLPPPPAIPSEPNCGGG